MDGLPPAPFPWVHPEVEAELLRQVRAIRDWYRSSAHHSIYSSSLLIVFEGDYEACTTDFAKRALVEAAPKGSPEVQATAARLFGKGPDPPVAATSTSTSTSLVEAPSASLTTASGSAAAAPIKVQNAPKSWPDYTHRLPPVSVLMIDFAHAFPGAPADERESYLYGEFFYCPDSCSAFSHLW